MEQLRSSNLGWNWEERNLKWGELNFGRNWMELEERENLGEKRWNWRLFVEGMELGCTMCSFFLIVKKVGIGGGWNHVWIGVQLGEDPVVPVFRVFATRGLVERGKEEIVDLSKWKGTSLSTQPRFWPK